MNALSACLDGLLKDVSFYFAHSTKDLRDFILNKKDFNIKHFKITKLSKTWWFSPEKVFTTLLEQYGVLVLNFQGEVKRDKIDEAKRIYDALVKHGAKHMLIFLQCIIKK